MSTTTTNTAVLIALRAIVAECMAYPTMPRYSTDSYLPEHLLEAAQQAIEQADDTDKAKENGGRS